MVRRPETDPIDRDEQLGEAIEAFLALAEAGEAPDPDDFAARYPGLDDDLRAALEGLAMVRGLVGAPEGPGRRLESGRRIAGYRIVRELGRGGMGTVYEAVHVGLDRPVALKVLGSQAAPDSNGRRRFLNEARTAAGLHHTHIVPVFDVGQVGGLCYYAMQRIEGSGLDHVLRHLRRDRAVAAGSSSGGSGLPSALASGWRPLSRWRRTPAPTPPASGPDDETATWFGRSRVDPSGLAASATGPPSRDRDATAAGALGDAAPDDDRDDIPTPFKPPRGTAYYRWVAEVGREAAEALAHAHGHGIIHRDVKPSNLLVDARGVVWVADFGLARRLADPAMTHHDSLLGTPRYMSPEQAQVGPIDGRTDVYSLGATLYELLTLRPPFPGRTAAELVAQIGSRDPIPPRQFDPRLPRDLETIVLKCQAKDPADRYATAADLAEDLERFLHFEPVRARRISAPGRLWRLARRHPSTSAITAAAAATVIAVATAAYVRVVHERDRALVAIDAKEKAISRTETANRATRDAMRLQLLHAAKVARFSTVPNRRAAGMALLKDAAALGPDPALRGRLRDEAAEFLVLRDVEARPMFATGPTRGLAFAPEGTRVATLSDDGREFSLWDVATRTRLEAHPLLTAANDSGPDGGPPRPPGGHHRGWPQNRIATAGHCLAVVLPDGKAIRLFDPDTGSKIRDLAAPDGRILSLLAAPGGQGLVTIESVAGPPGPVPGPRGRGGFEVQLYDPGRVDRPIATLASGESGPLDRDFPLVAIAPDGKLVATARTRETAVQLWSADDGQSLGTIETQAELTALALGPFGLLATAGGGEVRLWDVESRTPLPGFSPFQSFVRLLRFNPRGTLLAVAGPGLGVEVWDPASHTAVAVLPTADRAEDLAFSPDGRTLVAAGRSPATSVWEVVEPRARAQLGGFESNPTGLAFRDDATLAIGSWKGTVRFYRPGQCPSTAQQPHVGAPSPIGAGAGSTSADRGPRNLGDKPASLTFDDQGRMITVDADILRCWPRDPASPSPTPAELPGRSRGLGMFPPPLARAQGGRTLFVARGGRILAWHSDRPDHFDPVALPPLPDAHPADSFDRRRPDLNSWRQLVAGPNGDRLYLVNNAGEVHPLALDRTAPRWLAWDLPGDASALALSPDGATLAVGGPRGVALVDTARGDVRARLVPATDQGEGRVWALAFAPDGQTLAMGTQHGQVELWSPANPSAPLLRLPGHRGFITTLGFDPDGRYLASGGSDKAVQVWDLVRVRDELGRLGLGW